MLIRKFKKIKKNSIWISIRLAASGIWKIFPIYMTTNNAGNINTTAISTLAKNTEEKYSSASCCSFR